MSARRSLLVIAVAAAVGSTTVLTSVASGSVPDWSAPKRIPGTAGLVNPDPAVAPDGTELLIRLVSGTAPVSNAVVGRVRLPGETRWRHVPKGPEGTFLSVTDFAPTASGNFWVTYVTGSIGYTSFLVKFNAKKQRWSTPMRLFRDQKDHYHGSPEVEIAADGTLFVEAYAPPKVDPPGDPVARIAVGIRSPSGNWRNRFLTPADDFALGELAVNPAGDAVISFRQGYDLTAMTVRAATKAHGKNARWKIATLSPPGDSQRVHPAIGKDGTAAVVWSATSQTFDAIRMATRDVRRKLEPWVGRDVVTGASIAIDAYGVVNRRGETTVVWRQNGGGGTSALWSRHLDNTGLGPADQLTPNGEAAEFNALVQRPDDKAALVYQRFTPTTESLGGEFRTLNRGVASTPKELYGDEATDGNANSEFLGIDAASRGTMIYTRGDSPATDFAWLSQTHAPSVVTGPTTGKKVKRAHVKGALRIGSKVTCTSGYWVDASDVDYRWKRNGHRISGATGKRYQIRNRDHHKRLSCQVTGKDKFGGKRVLTSPPRRVG